tara:strand:- start:402 stop:746 length:345 start_codon:yes stop_codon:yes gene_type:complete
MAIPSASGSEVLKSITQSITSAYTLTPTDDHIYTILNIIVKNNHSSDCHFDIEVSTDSGSSYIWLMEAQQLEQDKTFVWSDKFVLSDNTARLRITNNGSDNLHFMINYIDQNWS